MLASVLLGGRTWSPPKHSMNTPSMADKLVVTNPAGSEMTDKLNFLFTFISVYEHVCIHVLRYTCEGQRATHKSRLSFLGLGDEPDVPGRGGKYFHPQRRLAGQTLPTSK